ncbi:MAG: phenylalanine 4-monooxygenase [Vicinamibacteria bacterium]|nr:phenylalanine 4-monooxygenase [Vicinamibacteria bacterium]
MTAVPETAPTIDPHPPVALPLDHPGASDPRYRARRDAIARLAHAARDGRMPSIDYLPDEHATWRAVASRLAEGHARHAAAAYRAARHDLGLAEDRIPDLAALSERLARAHGIRLAPVPGLIDSRSFLTRLGAGVLSCTTFIRHGSRPEYTPEPDVVHEVLGHAPLFADATFAPLSRAFGRAAAVATTEGMRRLERLYWFTLEFGLIEEPAGLRAYGAGLLSSFGELPHAFGEAVERRPFVLEEVLETPYDYTCMQPRLFVVPSFAFLERQVLRFLDAGAR